MKILPIIFCHFGISNYLKITLLSAKISNPQKNIFLLGDVENINLAHEIGINHILFSQFDSYQSVLEFNKQFKFIGGTSHGRLEWTKFVFLRWFYVNEFIIENNIESFWHFDSDNLIVSDLSQFEPIFSKFDNTEQCGGICINGFISSSKIIQLYTKHIIDLFNDVEYLNEQKIKCINNPSFAYTEMAAYNHFKKTHNLNTKRLHCLECDSTFDDCLASADGMEQSKDLYNGYKIKSIYIDKRNDFYFRDLVSNRFIKINSLNLSWMPYIVIFRLFALFGRSKYRFLRLRKSNYYKIDLKSYSILNRFIDKFVYKLIKFKYC
jgi:hypothetical protein